MGKLRTIVLILALLVFLGSGGYIGLHYYKAHKEESSFNSLRLKKGPDLYALHEKNPHTFGWIKVDGTKIDYPVMYTPEEPEYYLRKNFKEEYSDPGTPFLDVNSKPGESRNYLIYGHNMKTGTMFHDLLEFEKEKFWKEHNYFEFSELRNGKQYNGIYKIVAFFRSEIKDENSNQFKYYDYPYIIDEKMYNEYISGIKDIAAFDTGVKAKWDAQLVTLSTCAYHTDDGRFAVVGVKVDETAAR